MISGLLRILLSLLFLVSSQAFTRTWSSASVSGASFSRLTAQSSSSGSIKEVDCLVVGSGVSGSSLAFNLVHNQGIEDTLLVESNSVVGGNLISKEKDGFVWEEGPNSFQPTPYICRLVHELGLDDQLVLADGSLPRFVYWKGGGAGEKLANLHALPTNLPGDLFNFFLLTWPGKIRAGLGALGLIAPPPQDGEESIRDFVTRHLGPETFERVIDPFVSGVYAGDPDQLAMRAALKKIHRLEGLGKFGPGLVSGALTRFDEIAQEKQENPPDPAWPTYNGGQLGSFQKGLQTLPNAVETALGEERVWKNSPVKDIARDDRTGRFTVTVQRDGQTLQISAKSVCVTSPTRVTCRLAADLIPAAARLSEVYSPPVASVTVAYPVEAFRELPGGTPEKPLRGFGHLLPRSMKIRSLGTIWSSSLFPGRTPEGWELLLTYIGGARDTAVGDMSENDIYDQVEQDVQQILLKENYDGPSKRIGIRVWQNAIPQYRKGHLDILQDLAQDEAKCPGLYLGGNYRSGVAFGDCIQFGWTESERVAKYLSEIEEQPEIPEMPFFCYEKPAEEKKAETTTADTNGVAKKDVKKARETVALNSDNYH